ncbi:MAG TPA: translocation/assembly module TamB domain-containing protein [Caulobacteraceae bacterium]|nr:translocation/assembly module TamB domain-containing protein [Caulobacteraceae bacterium]
MGVIAVLLVAAMATLRYGVLTASGRALLEQLADGAGLGGYGRLHVEGLEGDIWSDFSLRRLTIDDAHGAWLDARDVRMRWEWPRLLARQVYVDGIDARLVTFVRRPEVARRAAGGPRAAFSLHLDKLAARVELLPAFSSRYGLYDLAAGFDVRRAGGIAGRLQATSLTHPGDRAAADFDLGRDKTVRLNLLASEANGGAIAGALGLAPNQPFVVQAQATGTTSQGQFQVLSRSGALQPIVAQGRWTPRGGQAAGRIVLAASKYLAGWQHMLGPLAQFRVDGARAPDGLDRINLVATSENIDLTAAGEADLGRQIVGPKGLQTALVVRDAERVIGWPPVGGARFAGVLTGRLDRWSATGALSADTPSAFDYRLARVAGPAKMTVGGGQIDLVATLDGEGGAGRGVVAALLGGRPHASSELLWLPDGRMLIKQLTVIGPGLKIAADGTRSLFGGLSFKGEATFTNFQVAHAGAKGLMTASWDASQAADGPWKFDFDGGAKDFASGVADLDRLVGAAPHLKAQGDWNGHAFEIAEADLTGAVGSATAAGLVGGDSSLQLKLGWQAKGPVDVGPIEITGAGEGSGALTGTIGSPRADLSATFASIGLPDLTLTNAHVTLSFLKGPADTNGAFALAASSHYGAARAETAFRFVESGVDLTGLTADAGGAHAIGSVALRHGAPSSADLTLSVGPGAFLSRGQASGRVQIAETAQGAHADVRLEAANALLREGGLLIESGRLSGSGPLAAMPYRIAAEGFTPHGSWRADGSGVLDGAAGQFGASFEGSGRLRTADFRTTAPAVLKWSGQDLTLTAAADVGGGKARIDARQTGPALRATADLTGVSLGLLDQDFVGRFDAEIGLLGQGDHLDGVMQAKLAGAGEKGLTAEPTLDGVVNASLSGGSMTLDAQLGNSQGLASHAHLVLPTVATAAPFRIAIVRTAPMKGEFQADGEVKPLWDLLLGGERSLGGRVHAVASLGGTLADPQAKGEATIAGGEFSDSATGLRLTGVTLAANLDQNAVDVTQFAGQDGSGGQVAGSGRVSLARAGASSFRLDLTRFRLLDNDIATAVASGQATLSRGADGAVKLVGALNVDRADVAANPPTPSGVTPLDVVEINRKVGTGGHLQQVSGRAPAVGLDVTLKAARNVFLKGRGLNAELSLDAHVTGTTDAPDLHGTAQIVRGDYDFAGKRFQFDNRGVVYLAADAEDIRLDLTATRDDPSLTAVIRVEGTAAKPKITLTSTPVLPNDEVLSQVLFGSSASQLSGLDAAELASAMTSLAGGGGFDVVGNLRSFAHLDRLALGGDTPGAFVSGGKYVTDNVYLEITGGSTGPSGRLEWRMRKDLSLISRVAGQGGDSQIEIRWRKDY